MTWIIPPHKLAALGREFEMRTAQLVLPTIEKRFVPFDSLEMRLAGDGTGTFEGYANLHGVVDSYGTRFRKAAWEHGTPDLGDPFAMLWMHNMDEPIGTFTAREDDKGLWIAGAYDATDAGQRARGRAQSGSAPGLSVGFVRLAVNPDDDMEIVQAKLVEVSQITRRMASQDGAEMTQVRKADALVNARRLAAARLRLRG